MEKIIEKLPTIDDKGGKYRRKLKDMFEHFGTEHLTTTIKVLINTTHKELCPELHEQYKLEELQETASNS